MKNLKGKKCLITGAASGIGRSLSIALAGEGMWATSNAVVGVLKIEP